MRKIVMIIATVVSLGVITIVAPTNAEARFGAGVTVGSSSAQPAQYYGGYGYGYRPYYYGYQQPYYYAPRYYAPRYYAPRYYRYY